MGRTRHLTSRARRRAGMTALLAAPLLVVAACGSSTPPAPTVKVDRGLVTSGVSASGTLVSVKEQNLGFADRGQVKELLVKVGDVVTAGQPLARLDDAAARSQLASAQSKLDQARAGQGKTAAGNTVESAQASLDSANDILSKTRANVDAINDADGSATNRAQVQLDFNKKQLDRAKDTLDDCQRNPGKYSAASGTTTGGTTTGGTTTGGGTTGGTTTGGGTTGGTTTGGATGTSYDGGYLIQPASYSSTSPATDTDIVCAQYATAVATAKNNVIMAQTTLDAAQQKQNTDATAGDLSISNAKKAVSDAQSTLTGAQSDKPFDNATQDATVADAQNTLNDAQTAVNNTELKAPIAGTISAINGAVGDFIAAQGGAGALAPGSDARIPPAANSASATDASGASSAAGGSFITLNNVDTFQLVVPFEESDAAKLAPNQIVDVSVDAVPGLTKPGTVVAVAPTAQQISGVVSYYTTIVLNESDPRLKDGQTADAQVTTQKLDNVLRVPSATVRTTGGRSTVNVPGADGNPVPTQFTPGLVGDSYTEVKDGLRDGQDILVPQAQVTASGGGGGGGGGGGRAGG